MTNDIKIVANDGFRDIDFLYESRGYKTTPINILKDIRSRGLRLATARETAALYKDLKSLVHTEGPSHHITNTGVIYTPGSGLYVVDKPAIVNNRIVMNERDLVERISSNDRDVRFVSEKSLKDIRSNEVFLDRNLVREPQNPDYAIALFGEELFKRYQSKGGFIHNSGWLKKGRIYMPTFDHCGEGCLFDISLMDITDGLDNDMEFVRGWGIKD